MGDFVFLNSADKRTAQESDLKFGFDKGDLKLNKLLLHLSLLLSQIFIRFYLQCLVNVPDLSLSFLDLKLNFDSFIRLEQDLDLVFLDELVFGVEEPELEGGVDDVGDGSRWEEVGELD
jgi:hypothetical protein